MDWCSSYGNGLERLKSPPPLRGEELAAEQTQFLAALDLGTIPSTPAVGRHGAFLIDPDERRPRLNYDQFAKLVHRREPAPRAIGKAVVVHQSFFAQEPWAELAADATVTVRFGTVRPVAGASAVYGTIPAPSLLALPSYRQRTTAVSRSQDGRSYSLSFSVRDLLTARYDIQAARASARGLIAWRLEAWDSQDAAAHRYEGVISFRCLRTPCAEGTELVALPTIFAGPFVDMVTPSRATISWTTDAATAGAVLVLGEDGKRRRVASPRPGTRHEVELTDLGPGRRYRYYVLVADARGEVSISRGATFATAPENPGQPFEFVVLSDSRSAPGGGENRYGGTNRQVLSDLLTAALRTPAHFAVFVGDLVDGYTTEHGIYRYELETWLRLVQPVAAYLPIYELPGNHEALLDLWDVGWAVGKSRPTSAEQIFAELMVNPQNGPAAGPEAPPYRENVYSWDYGNSHFAAVNSNYWYRSHAHRRDHPAHDRGQREGWLDDGTLAWLDQDLARARAGGAVHLFVFTHEPAFPNGGHVQDGMYWNGLYPEVLARRDAFIRLLAKHGVAALFHGDEHNYSRMLIDGALVAGMDQPLWQLTTGGAGAPYYAQDTTVPWVAHVRAFDARHHFVRVSVCGPRARARSIALTGEIIDEVELAPPPR